jgi:hypothetical protein
VCVCDYVSCFCVTQFCKFYGNNDFGHFCIIIHRRDRRGGVDKRCGRAIHFYEITNSTKNLICLYFAVTKNLFMDIKDER